jgi:endonuclease/exonuclease/phosphatase family metal-dependent hydrolase
VTCIFSKHEFLLEKQIDLWGDRHAVQVQTHQGELEIFGIHLDVYDESGATREKQIQQIIKLSEASETTKNCCIIAGDVNAVRRKDYSDEQWEKLQQHDKLRNVVLDSGATDLIEAAGFVDCFEACGKTPPLCTTWSGRRIDFIFVKSEKFQVTQAFVYHCASSDHIPVITDLRRKY